MDEFRFLAYFDQALFALLVVAGAFISGVFEVRGVMDVLTARSAHGTAVAATVQAPRATAAAASGTHSPRAGTVLARVSL